jgi:release factor glutamine methyltransferase
LKTAFKHIIAHTYKPLLVKYLSKTRVYRYQDIRLDIPPEVFHPGFFFSTQLLLQYVTRLPLAKKKFLEPGCGSGLISIVAAKQAAIVTATDINPVAVDALKKNSRQNKVKLEIILSDLFANIPIQPFDIIAINPPYYKKQPVTAKDYAWFCGEKGEYFSALFGSLQQYIHPGSEILMVLFEGCDMEMINDFDEKNGNALNFLYITENMIKKNFFLKIEKKK